MFGTNEKKEEKRSYQVKVDAARRTKNDSIVMIDLDINGVKVKSCMLKEIVCQKDGDKHKKGDICYVVNFPSEKALNGKYYNTVWCPLSNDNIEDIIKQVQSLI